MAFPDGQVSRRHQNVIRDLTASRSSAAMSSTRLSIVICPENSGARLRKPGPTSEDRHSTEFCAVAFFKETLTKVRGTFKNDERFLISQQPRVTAVRRNKPFTLIAGAFHIFSGMHFNGGIISRPGHIGPMTRLSPTRRVTPSRSSCSRNGIIMRREV